MSVCKCDSLKGEGLCSACVDMLRQQLQRQKDINLESVEMGEARAAIEGEPPVGGPFAEKLKQPTHDAVWVVEQDERIHSIHATYESAMAEKGENLRIGAPWRVLGRAERVLEAPPREPLTPAVFEEAVYQAQDTGSVHGTETYARRGAEYINSTLGLTARAAAPLPTAREPLEAMLTRYEALPGDDNLSVEFVRQDLRAVKAGTYDPHLR